MKKQELLNLYQQGERNFRRQNLSGRSFNGQDLSNADFSGADIRGTDFRNATLRGANFTEVQAGLQLSEAILLFIFLLLVTAILGACAGFVGTLLNLELRAFTSSFEEVTAGWVMMLLLLAFALVSVLEGVATGFNIFALAFLVAVAVAAIGPIFATLINPIAFAISSAVALAITITSSVTALTVGAVVVAIAAFRTFNPRAALVIIVTYVAVFSYFVATTDIVTSVVSVVPAVLLLSIYLGWLALQGDPKHVRMVRIAALLTTNWGTSFRNADLTESNFSHAKLKNTDFDEAMLTRVCWTGSNLGETPVLPIVKHF